MDIDILKPDDTGYLSVIERPSVSPKTSSRQTSSGSHSPEFDPYTEPLSEGEDEDMNFVQSKNEGQRAGLSGAEVEEAIAYREKMLKERKEEEESQAQTPAKGVSSSNGGLNVSLDDQVGEGSSTGAKRRHRRWPSGGDVKGRTLSIDPLAPSTAFDETLKNKLHETQKSQTGTGRRPSEERAGGNQNGDFNDMPSGDDRIMVRNWTAPPGKRISVPVRIEPKVYFAAERTFLVRSTSIPSIIPLTDPLFPLDVEMA